MLAFSVSGIMLCSKTWRTGSLTNGSLDENGLGLVGVDAVSCSADGLGAKDVLLSSLQSMDSESGQRKVFNQFLAVRKAFILTPPSP